MRISANAQSNASIAIAGLTLLLVFGCYWKCQLFNSSNQHHSHNEHSNTGVTDNDLELDVPPSDLIAHLTKLASRDTLTNVFNRRYFDGKLAKLLLDRNHSNHSALCLGLLLIDIDNFKSVNDKHGHQTGDEILRQVAGRLQQMSGSPLWAGSGAFVARYGGEEFVMVLSDTNVTDLNDKAEKVRVAIDKQEFQVGNEPGRVTTAPLHMEVSVGGTMYRDGESMVQFVGRADKALYNAKDNGKNRVVMIF